MIGEYDESVVLEEDLYGIIAHGVGYEEKGRGWHPAPAALIFSSDFAWVGAVRSMETVAEPVVAALKAERVVSFRMAESTFPALAVHVFDTITTAGSILMHPGPLYLTQRGYKVCEGEDVLPNFRW